MASISNVRIGACSVTFGGVDLGHTKDGVEFSFKRNFEDLMVDAYGETVVDKALKGQELTIKCYLAEPNVANLAVAIPEGELITGMAGSRLNLGRDAGDTLRQYADELVIHPLKNDALDDSEDIVIYKAVSIETVPMMYKIDSQRIIEVTFLALVDETYGSSRRLGHIGSATVS